MVNLICINLTLSQSLMQAQDTIVVLSKQLQALQTQEKEKNPTSEISVLYNKTKETKYKY